ESTPGRSLLTQTQTRFGLKAPVTKRSPAFGAPFATSLSNVPMSVAPATDIRPSPTRTTEIPATSRMMRPPRGHWTTKSPPQKLKDWKLPSGLKTGEPQSTVTSGLVGLATTTPTAEFPTQMQASFGLNPTASTAVLGATFATSLSNAALSVAPQVPV